MHSLPLFHRIAGQPVILVGDGPAAEAKRRLVERAGGRCVGEDHRGAKLAFVACEDPEPVANRLRADGLLVNVADRPDLCDFTLPSILERGPMLVAVSSGGASAGLTKALRLRLETLIPEGLGLLTATLAAARSAISAKWPDAAERRRALDAATASGGPLDPLAEHPSDAVEAWLANSATTSSSVHEFELTGDDPDDLTLRQARLLGTADLVRHDAAVSGAILVRARADAERRLLDDPRPDFGVTVILRRV